ncbi:MAG: hypothetical protein QM541_06345 [Flavobacterium sp.]|nr:hypothetical protein [Flavobacterium sp.]
MIYSLKNGTVSVDSVVKFYLPTLINFFIIVFFPYDRVEVFKVGFCYIVASFIFLLILNTLQKKNSFISYKWYYIFQLKLFVTILCAVLFFFIPLGNNIATTTQDSRLIDSTYYNSIAKILATDGIIKNLELAYSGWQTGGITVVVGFLYTIFSHSTLTIIIVNSFSISTGALLCYVLAKKAINSNINQKLFYFFPFLPIESFYDMSPSKEPFSLILLYAILYFLYSLHDKIKWYNLAGLAMSVTLLYMVRLNLLAAVIGAFLLYKAFYNISLKNMVLVIIVALLTGFILIYSNSLEYLATPYLDLEGVGRQIEQKEANDGLKALIINTFAATSVFSLIAYLPIRAIVWMFLPFPFLFFSSKYFSELFTSNLLNTDPFFWFHFFVDACSKVDSFIMILSFPFFLHFLFNMKLLIKTNFGFFIVIFFFFLLFTLSTYSFIEGTRYRSVLEPAYFMLLLSSLPLKMKSFNKIIACTWYPSVALLVLTIWLIESFK